MKQGRIVIITGAPGTGKTTAASLVAAASALERSVHLHTDDFYHALSKGAVPPHLPASQAQNQVVIEAFLACAKRFARGGYDVIVDGIVGPWFLEPFLAAVREGCTVHYLILRAGQDETRRRAVGRAKLDRAANLELVETMWEQFTNLGPYEAHVLPTTDQTAAETAAAILEKLDAKSCLLQDL